MSQPARARAPRASKQRQDNRRIQLMDAAATLFAENGFHAVSMRDIARDTGMLPGSLYYHFPSKDDLLLAIYEEGIRLISERVDNAAAGALSPWEKLEAAARAHVEMLLDESDYAQVILSVFPRDVPAIAENLKPLRDAYEDRFRVLIDSLPLRPTVDKQTLRLTLLGALNWAKVWHDPKRGTPAAIATEMLSLLKHSLV